MFVRSHGNEMLIIQFDNEHINAHFNKVAFLSLSEPECP